MSMGIFRRKTLKKVNCKRNKKLLTSSDEYAILLKLSREELLHNSKKEIKKLLTNMKHFDII